MLNGKTTLLQLEKWIHKKKKKVKLNIKEKKRRENSEIEMMLTIKWEREEGNNVAMMLPNNSIDKLESGDLGEGEALVFGKPNHKEGNGLYWKKITTVILAGKLSTDIF